MIPFDAAVSVWIALVMICLGYSTTAPSHDDRFVWRFAMVLIGVAAVIGLLTASKTTQIAVGLLGGSVAVGAMLGLARDWWVSRRRQDRRSPTAANK